MSELNSLTEKYKANKKSFGNRVSREVTDEDMKVLEVWKRTKNVSEAVKETGLSYSQVLTSLRIAALSQLR